MARNRKQVKVDRADVSVQQAVRIILEAYTGRTLGTIDAVHDHDDQYAVQVDDMQFLVNLQQWNNGLDLDAVIDTDVEEVEFTTWPPVAKGSASEKCTCPPPTRRGGVRFAPRDMNCPQHGERAS